MLRIRLLPIALLVGLASLAAPAASLAQGRSVLPHGATVDTLPNGMRVVVVPLDSPGILAYFTLMRVGSRDEVEQGHSGFAHLFEHMMFRGTEHLSGDEYEARVASFGADNNAYTTEDYTMFTVTGPSAVLEGIAELEADRFQHLSFDEATYRTETGAVLGEYQKDASSPFLIMDQNLVEASFAQHTYRHTVIGYLADVQAMPEEYEYSRAFFGRFYRPDNATLFVVGDVRRDRALDLVRRLYGSWAGHRDNPAVPSEPEPSAAQRRDLTWAGTTPPRMMIGYRIPAFGVSTPDSAALEVIHALVYGQSADLYQRLVVREQKLIELASWTKEWHRDPHLMVADASLREGTSFDEIAQAVSAEMTRIGEGRVSAARIDAVRSHLRYDLSMSLETPEDVAGLLGQITAATGDPMALDAYVHQLETLSRDDVARVARTYLTDARRTVVTIRPGAPPAASPSGDPPAATPAATPTTTAGAQ